MACDMTGGSSGGPWLTGFNETTGVGTLNSPQLVRLQRHQEHVRPEVQWEHPGHVQPREHGPTSNQTVTVSP